MVMRKKSAWRKNNRREIKHTIERYLAILAIIVLGTGFFAGLKVTQTAMIENLDSYTNDQNMYDFQIISTLGLSKEDVQNILKDDDISAEGIVSIDFIADLTMDNDVVLKAHSISQEINLLSLQEGRMPETDSEVLVDARYFPEDIIGSKIGISSSNDDISKYGFAYEEYTVVGRADSVNYLSYDRGTTKLAGGTVYGFIYMPEGAFARDYYTEILVRVKGDYKVYSEEYKSMILEKEESLVNALENKATFVLNRSHNIGYNTFENDSSIVDGIAKVLPIFFYLVAVLICSSTMSRMVNEQRTQIGSLKALGYSDGAIIRKYISYSGSAALIGWIVGFFLGTKFFPMAISKAYNMMYIMPEIKYVFDIRLALVSLLVSVLCSAGVTYLSCKSELGQMPAQLIRPKAPKAGKRVFLERIPFIWSRVSFLHKVAIRNIIRYKKRFFMIILGVSGCTALIVAAMGISDSIRNVANDQFDDIMVYDYDISFLEAQSKEDREDFIQQYSDELSGAVFVIRKELEVNQASNIKKVSLVATDDPNITNLIGLHYNGDTIPYPGFRQVAINDKLAKDFRLKSGDKITLPINGDESVDVEVGGIFENYVSNYLFMTEETYKEVFEEEVVYRNAYAVSKEEELYQLSAKLTSDKKIGTVAVANDMRIMIENMMTSLDSIILLVIACAVTLGFVVIYNLNNINITERSREIATIKVIGFYDIESRDYVYRETIILTIFGALLGLVLGKLLHTFIMNQINVEAVSFKEQVFASSYLIAFVITIVLSAIVNLMFRKKIENINMTESLKSVE